MARLGCRLPHASRRGARGAGRRARSSGSPTWRATLRKLVEAEQQALTAGKSRKEAIHAAYDRFYRGDIAESSCAARGSWAACTRARTSPTWKVHIEEPVVTRYKGIDVYKLTTWVQGPAMLQALNILEPMDLKAMGYNSARYIHTLYQVMNLAFADRDFYYGDPYFPPEEPIRGLLSKEYAAARAKLIDSEKNDPKVKPGDPYPFQGGTNPLLRPARHVAAARRRKPAGRRRASGHFDEALPAGTTSIEAADEEGWVVSVTPSGGWIPAAIAGQTGIGMSQRMQSFVLDEARARSTWSSPASGRARR